MQKNKKIIVVDKWLNSLTSVVLQVAGKDDETGEDLIQRDDDKPESVRNREAFHKLLDNTFCFNLLRLIFLYRESAFHLRYLPSTY